MPENILYKKLLLILPDSQRGYWGKVSKSGKAGFVRMALPTIAALTPSDWDVEIHDARTTPVDYDKKVDLVGITSYTADITNACKIAVVFRSEGVKVVMGGSLSFIYKKQGYQTLWYFDIIGPDLSFRCTYVLSVYK